HFAHWHIHLLIATGPAYGEQNETESRRSILTLPPILYERSRPVRTCRFSVSGLIDSRSAAWRTLRKLSRLGVWHEGAYRVICGHPDPGTSRRAASVVHPDDMTGGV